jgi:hypothetical protein
MLRQHKVSSLPELGRDREAVCYTASTSEYEEENKKKIEKKGLDKVMSQRKKSHRSTSTRKRDEKRERDNRQEGCQATPGAETETCNLGITSLTARRVLSAL